jgi:hypothetical protein
LKFFTSTWWSGCQAGDGGDALRQWQAHAASIRDRLPAALLALQETTSLHDATLQSLTVGGDPPAAVLKLRQYDGALLELRYGGLLEFESVQTPEQALGGTGAYGDLGYDEIDVVSEGVFEHRILFSSSIELRFRFRRVELQS